MSTPTAIIVDAYSTGARLPQELLKFGLRCIHVQSSRDVTAEFLVGFRPNDFDSEYVLDDDFNIKALRLACAGREIRCVIPGTETGVEAAERIGNAFGLDGNDPCTSERRRDKFEMHEQLRRHSLSDLAQHRALSAASACEWATRRGRWPLVAKPASSAGADGVVFCRTTDDVARAVDAVLGRRNKLGQLNDSVILQERIVGQQFIVNAVSSRGRHFVSEIWRDDKVPVEGASLICDREVLLAPDHPVSETLCRYVRACLDALGVVDGPSHTEVFQKPNGDFLLIETAARMQGTIDDKAVIAATGHSHVTLTAMRYGDPSEFEQLLDRTFKRDLHLHCVTLCSLESGTITKSRVNEKIGALESFRSLIHTPQVGDAIFRTVDLFTNPGIVYLVHRDEERLEADYRAIRAMEQRRELFEIA